MPFLGSMDLEEVGVAMNFDKVMRIQGYKLDVTEKSAQADARMAEVKKAIADKIMDALEHGVYTYDGVSFKREEPAEHTAGTTETGALT